MRSRCEMDVQRNSGGAVDFNGLAHVSGGSLVVPAICAPSLFGIVVPKTIYLGCRVRDGAGAHQAAIISPTTFTFCSRIPGQ